MTLWLFKGDGPHSRVMLARGDSKDEATGRASRAAGCGVSHLEAHPVEEWLNDADAEAVVLA